MKGEPHPRPLTHVHTHAHPHFIRNLTHNILKPPTPTHHTPSQCPHREYLSFVGELLLGLKYTPEEEYEGTSPSNGEHNGDIPVIRERSGGQLHIHVVEGAGIFDEDTRKPFNAVVKW